MKPYYVGDMKKRLAKLSAPNRERVLAVARADAIQHGSAADVEGNLYAVMTTHLKMCGLSLGKPRPKDCREAFLDYWMAHCAPVKLSRACWRKWIRMKGTLIYEAYPHFVAGWRNALDR